MIKIRKSGMYWEVIRNGFLYCYCTSKKLAEEIKEDLKKLERSLDERKS